jgi:hypothetical protein
MCVCVRAGLVAKSHLARATTPTRSAAALTSSHISIAFLHLYSFTSFTASGSRYDTNSVRRRLHLLPFLLILLDICPHTNISRSSYCFVYVLILLDICPHTNTTRSAAAFTSSHISSFSSIFVLILLYICPHTAVCTSSYC